MDEKPLPMPPVVVGGYGSPSTPRRNPVSGVIGHRYPADFPEESRSSVKLEQIRAARNFNENNSVALSEQTLHAMRLTCAMQPTLVFAREAIRLDWGANRVDLSVREFVRGALLWAGLSMDTAFEQSPEWRQYEDKLLASEDSQIQRQFF